MTELEAIERKIEVYNGRSWAVLKTIVVVVCLTAVLSIAGAVGALVTP